MRGAGSEDPTLQDGRGNGYALPGISDWDDLNKVSSAGGHKLQTTGHEGRGTEKGEAGEREEKGRGRAKIFSGVRGSKGPGRQDFELRSTFA